MIIEPYNHYTFFAIPNFLPPIESLKVEIGIDIRYLYYIYLPKIVINLPRTY